MTLISCVDRNARLENVLTGKGLQSFIGTDTRGNSTIEVFPFSNWSYEGPLKEVHSKIWELYSEGVYVLYQQPFNPPAEMFEERQCIAVLETLRPRLREHDIYFRSDVIADDSLPSQGPGFERINFGAYLRDTEPGVYSNWLLRATSELQACVSNPKGEMQRQLKRYQERQVLDAADEGIRPIYSTLIGERTRPAAKTYNRVAFFGALGLVDILMHTLQEPKGAGFTFEPV